MELGLGVTDLHGTPPESVTSRRYRSLRHASQIIVTKPVSWLSLSRGILARRQQVREHRFANTDFVNTDLLNDVHQHTLVEKFARQGQVFVGLVIAAGSVPLLQAAIHQSSKNIAEFICYLGIAFWPRGCGSLCPALPARFR